MADAETLTPAQTAELIRRAQAGDDAAQETLVLRNMALVRSIIRRYIGRGTEYDDLYQIGCMGLIKAIRNFDVSLGLRFSTYAVPMIAGEVKRFLRDDGMVKVSRSLKELAFRANAARERLSAELGREAALAEIAAAIEERPEDIVAALEAVRAHISINEPAYGEDSETTVGDRLMGGEDESEAAIDRVLLKELLRSLDPRERQIIVLRYFSDKTQSEIAKVLGVSQVQISRLENRILLKLREKAN